MVMGGYLTVAQVADELGFSPRTILRWIDAGGLEAVRLPGGRLRIPQSALAAMLAAGSTRSAAGIVAAVDREA
jgi:excisionase family DNA binding protein